jgi:hypothetical protein
MTRLFAAPLLRIEGAERRLSTGSSGNTATPESQKSFHTHERRFVVP